MARRDPVIIKGEDRGRPGRWIVHYYPTAGPNRTWKTFKSKQAAEEFRIEALQTTRGLDPNAEADYTVTLGSYATRQWLPQIKATVKPLTAQRYEQVVRLHLLPTLKDHKVRLLTRGRIKQLLISKLGDGLKRPTVTLILTTLRALLAAALDDGIIHHNPCLKLGRLLKLQASPGSVVNEQQVKAFTPEQMTRFLDAAKQSTNPYGPLFWLLALTGMRVGEAVAVRWSDFDLAQSTLHVQRTLSGGFLSTPKSGRDRHVSLSERAARLLHLLQLNRVDRAKRLKRKTIPEYAFTTKLGEPPSAHSIRVAFAQVLERAGLPSFHTPHSLRHSYASLLLRNGESLMFVKDQMGHATIAMTADLYGRWLKPEPIRGGANYLDSFTRPQTDSRTGDRIPLRALKGPQTAGKRADLDRTSCSTAATACTARRATTSSGAFS